MKIVHLTVALLVGIGLLVSPVCVPNSYAKTSVAKEVAKSKVTKSVSKDLPAKGSISINKANKDELMTIPGIGLKTADAIIDYRKANKFKSIDDLTNVKGIGDKTLANIKQYLKL